ncbi:tail fiber assembly protein [Serratia proteamaculans]|uniref:Tail fiber assembly protein n=1 Tax=Serratia proteamaculans TaxID=28151 RepID=A0ABS0TY19_SERPR|nr:tail fiber assembly protein [Serratia proteamaculans]MBI6183272.1 tail fiber assembly protein [Serratia proteamaculans]
MINLKNFQLTKPTNPLMLELAERHHVSFLIAETGEEWYEAQKLFADDTTKVMYDSNGIVRSITPYIYAMFPDGMSVAEVDELPDGADIDGRWVFDGTAVVPRTYTPEEIQSQAGQKNAQLLDEAYTAMKPLELAVKRNMATDEEKAQLEAWERYSVLLSRVDTSASDIAWPDVPA